MEETGAKLTKKKTVQAAVKEDIKALEEELIHLTSVMSALKALMLKTDIYHNEANKYNIRALQVLEKIKEYDNYGRV
jgi:hypothetical protein